MFGPGGPQLSAYYKDNCGFCLKLDAAKGSKSASVGLLADKCISALSLSIKPGTLVAFTGTVVIAFPVVVDCAPPEPAQAEVVCIEKYCLDLLYGLQYSSFF
jgi:hypothetical protein